MFQEHKGVGCPSPFTLPCVCLRPAQAPGAQRQTGQAQSLFNRGPCTAVTGTASGPGHLFTRSAGMEGFPEP